MSHLDRVSMGALVAAAVALGAPAVALASPYPLDQMLPEAAAQKLASAGVGTSSDMVERGALSSGRRKLARATGFDLKQITSWVQLCDLVRLDGVGPIMARLLAAAKVTGIAKLKRHRAKALFPKLMKVNDRAKISENPPTEQDVAVWIEQAKKLKVIVR